MSVVERCSTFCGRYCGVEPSWTPEGIIKEMTPTLTSSPDRKALVGVSGGVDRVAAALVHHAIGDQLEAVFVDNGLLPWRAS